MKTSTNASARCSWVSARVCDPPVHPPIANGEPGLLLVVYNGAQPGVYLAAHWQAEFSILPTYLLTDLVDSAATLWGEPTTRTLSTSWSPTWRLRMKAGALIVSSCAMPRDVLCSPPLAEEEVDPNGPPPSSPVIPVASLSAGETPSPSPAGGDATYFLRSSSTSPQPGMTPPRLSHYSEAFEEPTSPTPVSRVRMGNTTHIVHSPARLLATQLAVVLLHRLSCRCWLLSLLSYLYSRSRNTI
ncbi:hypothetical protein GGX14DRAFT_554221 [Mycena pura]|uniref:Uncharacterized protein n=1 Tax=Mycena pura TaxID=153505 RepID=A0AAD6YVU4_9AGAR|nr:hypothetical protein GGX14DRAFT_554221 [Mycena pura]